MYDINDNDNICRICLHTDRKLEVVDHTLSEFHDEFCNYSLDTLDPQYCAECVYLLKKTLNFKMKCELAIKIYKDWKTNTHQGQKPGKLYEKLPPTSLGVWVPNKYNKIFSCWDVRSTSSKKVKSNKQLPNGGTKLKTFNNSALGNDTNSESAKQSVNIIQLESSEDSELDSVDDNEDGGYVQTDHCYTKASDRKNSPTGKPEETEFVNFPLSPDESIDYDMIVTPLNVAKSNDDIYISKAKESTANKSMKLRSATRQSVQNNNNDKDSSSKSKESASMILRSVLERSVLKRDDDKYINKAKERKNDNNKDINKSKESTATKTMKLGSVTTHSVPKRDDDKDINKAKERKNDDDKDVNKAKESTETNTTKLSSVTTQSGLISDDNKELNESTTKINIKERSVTENRVIDKDNEKVCVSGDLSKKAIVIDSDTIVKNCEKARQEREKLSFSKERLKAELIIQFASCDEVKAVDGTVIDKQFILNLVDVGKVSDHLMRKLWNAVHGINRFESPSIILLKYIQDKYEDVEKYKSVFDIEYLDTEEQKMEEFQRRLSYPSYVGAEYKCKVCRQSFKYKKVLDNHKKYHDISSGGFMCEICGVRQKTMTHVFRHMMKGHEAVYKCKLCPMTTYYRHTMMNHYRAHKGMEYTCDVCNKTFMRLSVLKNHLSRLHPGRHVCTDCGRAFYSEMGLKWHSKKKHQNKPPQDGAMSVKCEECQLSFPSLEVMLRHVDISHDGPRGTREIVRPKKPEFICRVCNAVGNSHGWLILHFKLEHPTVNRDGLYADTKKHLCDICGKGFTSVYGLRDHQNIHAGVRPFACTLCPKRFHYSQLLRVHAQHHAPASKPCPHCGRRFKYASNLRNHIRLHTGNRPYVCSTCGKGFIQRNTLNAHILGVHHKIRRGTKRTANDALDTDKQDDDTAVNSTKVDKPEVNNPEVVYTEVNDPEDNDPDGNDTEVHYAEDNDEVDYTEVNDTVLNYPEVNDPEGNNMEVEYYTEVNDPDFYDPDVNDPKAIYPKLNDPESSDAEFSEPEAEYLAFSDGESD